MTGLRNMLRRRPRIELAYHTLRKIMSDRGSLASPTRYGFRMAGNEAISSGEFEAQEVDVIGELLPRHDRLIDIGANIGFYSCLARQMGKPVMAIEPLRENIPWLLNNLSANGWQDTEVIVAGLSDETGIGEIFGSDTSASLVPGWAARSERSLLRERIVTTTLDSVLAHRFHDERLLIKVDVEGAEFALLKGAAETLSRKPAPTWLVEICLSENFPGGRNPRYVETFDLFFDVGYRALTANSERRPVRREDVADWNAAGRTPSGVYNYLFRS
jgi:FkbM family methyltransferase